MTRSMRIMFLALIAGLGFGLVQLRSKNDSLAAAVQSAKPSGATTVGAE